MSAPAKGKYEEALTLYKQAVAISADLPMLAEMSNRSPAPVTTSSPASPTTSWKRRAEGRPAYGRELALFWCDHNRNLPEALELARKELEVRRDVTRQDVLAWALCKTGRFKEAEAAMNQAMKLGTADARFLYHAGMIPARPGKPGREGSGLSARALALNRCFSPKWRRDAPGPPLLWVPLLDGILVRGRLRLRSGPSRAGLVLLRLARGTAWLQRVVGLGRIKHQTLLFHPRCSWTCFDAFLLNLCPPCRRDRSRRVFPAPARPPVVFWKQLESRLAPAVITVTGTGDTIATD